VLILREGNRILLEKRPPSGIWGGLLGLPVLPDSESEPAAHAERVLGCVLGHVEPLMPVEHAFTHFRLQLQPLLCEVSGHSNAVRQDAHVWVAESELDQAPLPAPIRKLLKRLTEPSLFQTEAH
jgi:A/G-specific adenine glycosylase